MKKLNKLLVMSWRQFVQDRCLSQASSLAYVTLLSIVPLLTVSFAVLSGFPVFKELSIKVQGFIFDNFIAESARVIQHYIQNMIMQTAKLSAISMVFLLISAVLLVFSMEESFNYIWRVKRSRHGVTAFLLYWAVITLIPISIAAALWVTNYVENISWITRLHLEFIGTATKLVMPYLATLVAFTLLYIALPNCKVKLRSAFPAALFATIIFELARKGFTWYIIDMTSYKVLYGALAAIPIFLLWLYVSWLIILLGVVINYVLATLNKS